MTQESDENAHLMLNELISLLRADMAALSRGDWSYLSVALAQKLAVIEVCKRESLRPGSQSMEQLAKDGLHLAEKAHQLLNLATEKARARLSAIYAALGSEADDCYGPTGSPQFKLPSATRVHV